MAINQKTGRDAKYRELANQTRCKDTDSWHIFNGEEIYHMVDGKKGLLVANGKIVDIPGTNKLALVHKNGMPDRKNETIIHVVVADQPEKASPKHVQWTAGGNLVEYEGNCSTDAACLITAKVFINIIISTAGAQALTLNLKDFFNIPPVVL